jgi:hypothetical protein
LIGGHVADLGGRDAISEAEFCIVRRCALLNIESCSKHASRPTTAQPQSAGHLVAEALARVLGLQRRQKDVTGPTLGQILREGIRRDREAADAEIGG